MNDLELYSVNETRRLLGGIARNTLYRMLANGELPSVMLGCRRFISAAAIAALISKSTTTVSPTITAAREHRPSRGRRGTAAPSRKSPPVSDIAA